MRDDLTRGKREGRVSPPLPRVLHIVARLTLRAVRGRGAPHDFGGGTVVERFDGTAGGTANRKHIRDGGKACALVSAK